MNQRCGTGELGWAPTLAHCLAHTLHYQAIRSHGEPGTLFLHSMSLSLALHTRQAPAHDCWRVGRVSWPWPTKRKFLRRPPCSAIASEASLHRLPGVAHRCPGGTGQFFHRGRTHSRKGQPQTPAIGHELFGTSRVHPRERHTWHRTYHTQFQSLASLVSACTTKQISLPGQFSRHAFTSCWHRTAPGRRTLVPSENQFVACGCIRDPTQLLS